MKKYAIQYTAVYMPTHLSQNKRDTRDASMILELSYDDLDETVILKKIKDKLIAGSSSNKIQNVFIRSIRFLAAP